ncbi:putative O-sialoglyco protein endopeptidase [Lineolata rhizophorae]|uniref:Putative O-sialoglyco protein endopeptidase n=1 Tax=Lineolata rhizophorae TaxID=578093 RepID=A0A6A6PD54_9PEZI|nr:putative O-sialoglyco protein endopeptidase [Lineolata rhizophorae]
MVLLGRRLRATRPVCKAACFQTSSAPSVNRPRPLVTLAIETSCDDTAVAVLEKHDNASPSAANNNPVATLHFNDKITSDNAAYRGIHPLVALQSHQENLATLVARAVQHIPRRRAASETSVSGNGGADSRPPPPRPDFVSVTRGPGMLSNLNAGLDFAKGLAVAWGVPLVGVHHMQAHALTPRLVDALARPAAADEHAGVEPAFPFLSLLASGGHTLLVRSAALAQHEVVAATLDVALGDCVDKVARAVVPASHSSALPPGPTHVSGPALEAFAFPLGAASYSSYVPPATRGAEIDAASSRALCAQPRGWTFTPPLAQTRSLAFSFTSLTAQADRLVARLGAAMTEEERRDVAREAQRVAFEHVAGRVVLALEAADGRRGAKARRGQERAGTGEGQRVETLVLSGGVAANGFLRHVLRRVLDVRGFAHVKLCVPPTWLCTDNAAMVAWTGIEMFEAGWRSGLGIRAAGKWPLGELLDGSFERMGN